MVLVEVNLQLQVTEVSGEKRPRNDHKKQTNRGPVDGGGAGGATGRASQ